MIMKLLIVELLAIYKMVKETVVCGDGTEIEINVTYLGGRKALQLQKKYLPLSEIKQSSDGMVQVSEKVDLAGMIEESLTDIEGFNIDKVKGSECGRIFNKYYFPEILGALGVSNNPN